MKLEGTIEPLKTSRQVLIWLSVCPADANTTKKMKLAHLAFSMAWVAITICGFLASFGFFINSVSTNLEESLYALFQVFANLVMQNTIIVTFVMRHKIAEFFQQLSQIYNKSGSNLDFCLTICKYVQEHLIGFSFCIHLDLIEGSIHFLDEASNNSEWIWTIFVKLVLAANITNVMLVASSIYFCWILHGTFDIQHIYHPFKVR